ncbi:glycine cleavage T C-terminal barrel domain-containing protein, partial [Bacillus sp. SIMBA_154]
IKTEFSEVGTEVEVEIRKKTVKAKIVRTPFYKRPKQS